MTKIISYADTPKVARLKLLPTCKRLMPIYMTEVMFAAVLAGSFTYLHG